MQKIQCELCEEHVEADYVNYNENDVAVCETCEAAELRAGCDPVHHGRL
ncbi:hypothetical protein [Actinomycetia phage DSL-LC01]|nr:hypothetical protein [Actinomycetia phage DSL-LC01]